MSRKIAVILNEEQIRYLWGHAIEMEDKAKDAGRSHSERFFIGMQEVLFNAKECNEFHLTIPVISGGEYATPERANRTVQQLWERAAIAA